MVLWHRSEKCGRVYCAGSSRPMYSSIHSNMRNSLFNNSINDTYSTIADFWKYNVYNLCESSYYPSCVCMYVKCNTCIFFELEVCSGTTCRTRVTLAFDLSE